MQTAPQSISMPPNGSILSGPAFLKLIEIGEVEMENFSPSMLTDTGYSLQVGTLWRPSARGPEYLADMRRSDFVTFEPDEYLIATPIEGLSLPVGIVAVLFADRLAARCFSLVSGKIDPGYGRIGGRRQSLIFGLKNEMKSSNRLYSGATLGELMFLDFRESMEDHGEFWTPQDRLDLRSRERFLRAYDDGPQYE